MELNDTPNEPMRGVDKMDKPTTSNENNNDKINNVEVSEKKLLPAVKKQRTPKQLEAFKKMREQRQKNLELQKQLKSTKGRKEIDEYEEDTEYQTSEDLRGGGMNNPPAVAVAPQRPKPKPKPEPTRPKPPPRQLKPKPKEEQYYEPEEEQYYETQNIYYNYKPAPIPQKQKINYIDNPYGLNTITYNPRFIQQHVNTEQNSRRVRRQIPNIPWNPNAYY